MTEEANRAARFLARSFKSYYFRHVESVEVPVDIRRREFGYLTFDGDMVRHLTYPSQGEFKAAMVMETPRSAYCSVAYYDFPALPMEEKGYRKADLAFDIDSDDLNVPCTSEHDFDICGSCGRPSRGSGERCPLCGSTSISAIHWVCDRCLGAAKDEAVKLVDFLELDFGISPDQIGVYFSGNRGFHLLVVGSRYETLDQRGRSEMVEYLEGKGFAARLMGLIPKRSADELMPKVPTSDEPGWRGRVMAGIQRIEGLGSKEALVQAFLDQPERVESLIKRSVELLGVKLDEGVTIDTHRVFRLGGTLHDKSGLVKKRYRSLDDAGPLVDAVAFGSERVRVQVEYSPKFWLLGNPFGPYERTMEELPMYAAVYLVAKGLAQPVTGE